MKLKFLLTKIFALFLINTNIFSVPIINITPLATHSESQLTLSPFYLPVGQNASYIYQIHNNTNFNLKNVGINYQRTPSNINLVDKNIASLSCNDPNFSCQYCSNSESLNANQRCLIKANVASTQNILSGPILCTPEYKSVYCNSPVAKQIYAILSPNIDSCDSNVANFNNQLSKSFDAFPNEDNWGPARNHLPLSTINPNFTDCVTDSISDTAKINFMQNRVLAAYDFWIKQKLNYCHHHVPDFATTQNFRGVPVANGGYCSTAINIKPNTAYYNLPVRWNYSGFGAETLDNWINNDHMWYGIDCSDFTSFIYNFAFGIQFNSDTGFQAGQKDDPNQDLLTPNAQISGVPARELQIYKNNEYDSPAGTLLCLDGTTDTERHNCGSDGTNRYFSVFPFDQTSKPFTPDLNLITDEDLLKLQPGDLIFLAFNGASGNNKTSIVTHVITWTGKKVGYGPNDISPDKIAPNDICPNDWQPNVSENQWVIIDSHYQGPDYRVFTDCFYKNHIWGVRRVIGYMAPRFS